MSPAHRRRDNGSTAAFVLGLIVACFAFYLIGRAVNVFLRELRWIRPRLPVFVEPGDGEDFPTLAELTEAYPWEAFGGREACARARVDRQFAWALVDAGFPERPLFWTDRAALTVIGAMLFSLGHAVVTGAVSAGRAPAVQDAPISTPTIFGTSSRLPRSARCCLRHENLAAFRLRIPF